MYSSAVLVLLVIIVLMMVVGFYFIFSGQSAPRQFKDEGVRIVGSEHSIVSVRKVSEPGGYEVRVEDAPGIDFYDDDLFMEYQENLFDRWMRDDISDEERARIIEEIAERHGIELPWNPDEMRRIRESAPAQEPAAGAQEVADESVEEEEVDPDTQMPLKGKVNSFDYDPFSVRDERSDVLLAFIRDSYLKGLLKPEILLYAYDVYGMAGSMAGIDIERLKREQKVTGARVPKDVVEMPLEEFDIYVHAEVAAAGGYPVPAVEDWSDSVPDKEEVQPQEKGPEEHRTASSTDGEPAAAEGGEDLRNVEDAAEAVEDVESMESSGGDGAAVSVEHGRRDPGRSGGYDWGADFE